jgi:hypothetical protein
MMGQRIRLDLPDDTDSEDSTAETEILDEIDSSGGTVEGTGEHAFCAFHNWSGIFGHDDSDDNRLQQAFVTLNDVPILDSSPPAGSPTATESEATSASESAYTSSDDTGAATPIAAPKTVKDVKFVQTRLSASAWG